MDKVIVTGPDYSEALSEIASDHGWGVIVWESNIHEDVVVADNETYRVPISVETRIKMQMHIECNAMNFAKDYHKAGIEKVLIILESGILDITDDPKEWGNFGLNHSDMVTRRYDAAVFVPENSAWTKYHPHVIRNTDEFLEFLSK